MENLKIGDLKFLVWERDNWKCRYCNVDLYNAYAFWKRFCVFRKFGYKVSSHFRPTVDHVFPKSKGGKNKMSNLVTCCYFCNVKKGSNLI